jgi:hypothetical protein
VILVLAHHYDAEAEWLCMTLRREHIAALLLWPEALGVDYRISLFLGHHEAAAGEITFLNERELPLESHSIRYALNRLGYIEPLMWDRAAPRERAYATSEINAFFSAFIRALPCPVSNPVRNGALWTGAGFEAKWFARLRRHGVGLHALASATPAEAWDTLASADRAQVRRWLYFEGELFSPPDQEPHREMESAIRDESPDEMLEFIAIQETPSRPLQLLWVTRTPAVSCYAPDFLAALIERAEADQR